MPATPGEDADEAAADDTDTDAVECVDCELATPSVNTSNPWDVPLCVVCHDERDADD